MPGKPQARVLNTVQDLGRVGELALGLEPLRLEPVVRLGAQLLHVIVFVQLHVVGGDELLKKAVENGENV